MRGEAPSGGGWAAAVWTPATRAASTIRAVKTAWRVMLDDVLVLRDMQFFLSELVGESNTGMTIFGTYGCGGSQWKSLVVGAIATPTGGPRVVGTRTHIRSL